MSAPRGGKPWIWITWLTPLLAGEAQCQYAAWFKSHYRYVKRPDTTFNLAAWNADHSALLDRRRHELEANNWKVTVENSNAFRLNGSTAIVAGKPDLLASKNGSWLVVDTKMGQQKNKDWWQALLYMFALPKAFGMDAARLYGEICYPSHRVAINPAELTGDRVTAISTLIRSIGQAAAPSPIPSEAECRWCDVAECTARIDAPVTEVLVSEF